MSCGVGHRCGSELMLLWLWCRLTVAALILPLAWELPYAMGTATHPPPKKERKKKKTTQVLNLPNQESDHHFNAE